MTSQSATRMLRGALALVALFALTAAQKPAPGPLGEKVVQRAVSPEAEQALRKMADYLAGLKSFRVQGLSIDEVVLTTGQKIQSVNNSQVSVQRPNRLRSEQIGPGHMLAFWYDGKTMTLACAASNTYAAAPAPPTLDATIDAVRKKYDLDAPGADLLFSNPFDILMEQVTGGQVIDHEMLDEAPTTHLAFVGEEVDWQIWIQDGAQPLPLRFVITTKTLKQEPQFTVQLSHWEPQASLNEATFAFKPPSGATRVESFPTSCGASR